MEEQDICVEIPGYQLIRLLRVSATTAVYMARHDNGLLVATKVAINGAFSDPFALFRNARVTRMLEGSAPVRVIEYGLVRGRPWCAMELPDGESLDVWMTRTNVSFRHRLHVVIMLAKALGSVNGQGIVHRDVQPAHVIVERSGGVRLLSFGLALTYGRMLPMVVRGVPTYVAPEELLGNQLDERIDVYALGVTARHVLSGRVPPRAESVPLEGQTWSGVRAGAASNRLSARLECILDRATATDRTERHPTMAALIAELADVEFEASDDAAPAPTMTRELCVRSIVNELDERALPAPRRPIAEL